MKIGFIGAGNMASAIINGIVNKNLYSLSQIYIYDTDKAKVDTFASLGMNACLSIEKVAKESDIIFLAVKPQNFPDVLNELKSSYRISSLVVSIAAGISTAAIKAYLGTDSKVIRTMPNTPLMLGHGATALSHVPPVSDSEFKTITEIFNAVGTTAVLPEDKMNEVVSVNASSPAYVYLFAKAMIESAEKQGIDRNSAFDLVIQSIIGSAYMLRDSGSTPDELIHMVSSPGGTTLKALEVFNNNGFIATVDSAMQACTRRARELSGE